MSSLTDKAEEKAREILVDEYFYISQHLMFRDIKCELISEGILTLDAKSRIEFLSCDNDRISELIDRLLRSNIHVTLPKFFDVLTDCGYKHVAKKIEPAVKCLVRALRRTSPLEEFEERLQLMREMDAEDILLYKAGSKENIRRQISKDLHLKKCNNCMEDTLFRCWSLLCNNLIFNDMLDTIVSKGIITQVQKQYICSEKSDRDQMDSFLTVLVKSDLEYTFPQFTDALKELGYDFSHLHCIREELLHVYGSLSKK